MSGRVPHDDPLQDFMNDVVKVAKRARRDAARRDREAERRKRLEEIKEADALVKKKKKERIAAVLKSNTKGGRSVPPSREGGPKSATDGGNIQEEDEEEEEIDAQPKDKVWKRDVTRLKSSLAAFDVSTDGLRITWHSSTGKQPSEDAPPSFSALPRLSKSVGATPSKSSGRGGGSGASGMGALPKIGAKDRGGLGALAAADALAAAAVANARKESLGFECHPKYNASPLFTEQGAEALKKKAALQTTKRDESSGAQGALGGPHPFVGGSGMVSATDGLKRAIVSGKIVSQDGVAHQSAVAELQGPTAWSGADLGIKYRGESEREAAWRAYVQADKASAKILSDQGAFFATAAIARHVLYQMLDANVADENELSLVRARLRGSMRRFVKSVHQIWLTNLEHIREHRLGGLSGTGNANAGYAERLKFAARNTASNSLQLKDEEAAAMGGAKKKKAKEDGGDDGDGENDDDDDDDDAEALAVLLRAPPDRGLPSRRDTEAIVSVSSQVQSVAATRTWESVPRPRDMGHISGADPFASFQTAPTPGLAALPTPPPAYRRLLANEPLLLDALPKVYASAEANAATRKGASTSASASALASTRRRTKPMFVCIDRLAMSDEAETFACDANAPVTPGGEMSAEAVAKRERALQGARYPGLDYDDDGDSEGGGSSEEEGGSGGRRHAQQQAHEGSKVSFDGTVAVGADGQPLGDSGQQLRRKRRRSGQGSHAAASKKKHALLVPGLASSVRPPLWRITCYDRNNGSQGRIVIPEAAARRAVAAAKARGFYAQHGAFVEAEGASLVAQAAEGAAAALDELKNRQASALTLGDYGEAYALRSEISSAEAAVAEELRQRTPLDLLERSNFGTHRAEEMAKEFVALNEEHQGDCTKWRQYSGTVHRQVVRVAVGNEDVDEEDLHPLTGQPKRRGFLVQLSLAQFAKGTTPLQCVLTLLPLRQNKGPGFKVAPPKWLRCVVSISEVKARLGLMDAPTADLQWWLPKAGNVGASEWGRLLTRHVRCTLPSGVASDRRVKVAEAKRSSEALSKAKAKAEAKAEKRRRMGVGQKEGGEFELQKLELEAQAAEAAGSVDLVDDLFVRVEGSDEPLDDVRGAPFFDSDVCDDALLLLPLLRWGPLLHNKSKSRNDSVGGGAASKSVPDAANKPGKRASKSAAATAAAGAAAAAAAANQAENGGGPAVSAAYGGTAVEGALCHSAPQGALFELGLVPSLTDQHAAFDFGTGNEAQAAQARKDAHESELNRRELLPSLPPHGVVVGGGGINGGPSLTTLLSGCAGENGAGAGGNGGSTRGSGSRGSVSGGGGGGGRASGIMAAAAAVVAVDAWPLGVADRGDLWDDAVEWGPDNMSLSMLASGVGWAMDRVPGATTIPSKVRTEPTDTLLWFKYVPVLGRGVLPVPEMTRVVANHFRQLGGPNGPSAGGVTWYPGGAAARLAKAERARDGRFAASSGKLLTEKAHTTGSAAASSSSLALFSSEDQEATKAILDITGRGPANTVVCNLALALDTPLLTPPLVAWVHQCLNAPSPGEEAAPERARILDGWVCFQCNSARATRMGPVESQLDARVSQPLVALTAAEHALDFAIDPKDVNQEVDPEEGGDDGDEDGDEAGGEGGRGGDGKSSSSGKTKLTASSLSSSKRGGGNGSSTSRVGHRRRWHWRHGPSGFRHLLQAPLLFPSSHVASRFFGLTLRGALPNVPTCGTGHRWCSAEGCRKALTRLRSADEYSKLAQAQGHQGSSDPGIFTCHLRGVCDQLSMDEVISFVDNQKLNIDLRGGQTTVDELRTMTLEGARSWGWPEGDAARLLTKVDQIRERTANETAWHVELYKVALGGMSAFLEWHEMAEETRRIEAEAKAKEERMEAVRRLLAAKQQLLRDRANEEIRLAMFGANANTSVAASPSASSSAVVAVKRRGEDSEEELSASLRKGSSSTTSSTAVEGMDESALIRELASDHRLLRLLADQLGLPPQIVDELALAAEEQERALQAAALEAEAAVARSKKGAGAADDDEEEDEDDVDIDGDEDDGLGSLLNEFDAVRDRGKIKQLASNKAAKLKKQRTYGAAADMPLLADLLQEDAAYQEDDGNDAVVTGGNTGGQGNRQPRPDNLIGGAVGGGGGGGGGGKLQTAVVPSLDFAAAQTAKLVPAKGAGWRRLQRETPTGFLARATSTHVQGPKDGTYNSFAEMRVVGLVDPEEDVAFDYELSIKESAPTGGEALFVGDVLQDTVRLMEIEAGRRTREDYMYGGGAYSQVALRAGLPPGPGNSEVAGGAAAVAAAASSVGAGMTSEERMLMEEVRGDELEVKASWEEKLLTSARNGNMEGVADALGMEAFIDSEDDNGNTAIVLASQQGNKLMIKELMRQGANLNHQNRSGCSVLHYCFEYKHRELADYLIAKGADDGLLNAEGLTCYEGLHASTVSEI